MYKMMSRIQVRIRTKPFIFSTVDKKERSRLMTISTSVTLEQKQILIRRAEALGISLSTLLRDLILQPNRIPKERLTRKWVAVGLLLQKIHSNEKDQPQLQLVLEQIKSLIQQSFAGPHPKER